MRPQRRRVFGHPLLVRYLQELGAAVDQKGLGCSSSEILDSPRWPDAFGHRSHQIGLDADIWFWLPGDGMARWWRIVRQSGRRRCSPLVEGP
jgi:penicillin-insensitive murein endopeptidase